MAASSVPVFSGVVLRVGSRGGAVRAVQRRLNRLGCGPVDEDGVYGPQTADAVRLFQARAVDARGVPLAQDGIAGALTWAALFGSAALPPRRAPNALLREALKVASAQVGKREVPPGSNRGPEVDAYLRAVGLDPAKGHFPWCAAFVFWCFREAAKALGKPNPAPRTPGALDSWDRALEAGAKCVSANAAHLDESRVLPGQVFVLATGGGFGHTGFVSGSQDGLLATIEGNANESGGREGIGVFARRRNLRSINVGFIQYA
jgi:hypothetical protein